MPGRIRLELSHTMIFRVSVWFAQATLIYFLTASLLSGQARRSGQELTIASVNIEFIELENVNTQVVRANMQSRAGGVYDEGIIDSDIRSLYRTGLFEYIEVLRDFDEPGTVVLTFRVRPKYRISEVTFSGNERIRNRRLRREISVEPNTALDERLVRLDAEAIHTFYQRRGYSNATVTHDIQRDPQTGLGKVAFTIEEGPRKRISRVHFEGNETISDRRLRRAIETRRWHVFSWLTGRGRYKDEVFEDDLDKIRDLFREEGFLDVTVREDDVTFVHPNENRMEITVKVREGRRYRLGEITIEGNTLYSEEELRSALRMSSGDVFTPSRVDADTEHLRDYYGREGYLDTEVRALRRPNLETGDIDLIYEIVEGGQYHLESIHVEGNTKTKSVVIIRELALGPGEVFNTVRMKNSQRRLENTRFFDTVNLQPVATEIPERRDLRISVTEGRTGNLSFGLGFSSLERAIVFAEVSQGNFDLFNPRSGFQGAGQKFRFRVQLGTRSNEVILSFEEPWLFHRELALGFQIYRTETRYLATTYNELRTGIEVYLRKRLFELVEGRLSYRIEVVDIFDVRDAPFIIQNEEGKRSVSKVGFSLLRDTRDSLLVTTRGNRVELLTEVAGGPFRGQTDYYRVEARGSQFYQVFEAQTQVISFIGRMGSVQSFGDSPEVPFFDRYFLGGPYTMRGFDFRDVGPRWRDDPRFADDPRFPSEPIGGSSYGFMSLEYTLTVVEPIRFAVFYDWGFVNMDKFDFDPSDYNDNFGFGFRLMVMGAPLRFDYGIPITSDDFNDRGGRFSFSFGTRF